MNLQFLKRALGGDIADGKVHAPAPGHSKHDRSMTVFLDPQAPGRFRVHCFTEDWKDCRDFVKARLGVRDRDHDLKQTGNSEKCVVAGNSDADRIRYVRAIWNEAAP